MNSPPVILSPYNDSYHIARDRIADIVKRRDTNSPSPVEQIMLSCRNYFFNKKESKGYRGKN